MTALNEEELDLAKEIGRDLQAISIAIRENTDAVKMQTAALREAHKETIAAMGDRLRGTQTTEEEEGKDEVHSE